ncbi:MAG: two-component regulator propeller domain-containing protein, partial [Candidatus Diapherotrites archaeon]|nr:two-component regulator propeller domain-containing protein [Candidatus Diapherotrites archaeon]
MERVKASCFLMGKHSLKRRNPDSFLNLTVRDGLATSAVAKLLGDPFGALWIGFGVTEDVLRIDPPGSNGLVYRANPIGLPKILCRSIAHGRDGAVWISGLNNYWSAQANPVSGIYRIEGTNYTRVHPDDAVLCAGPDGTIWAVAKNQGFGRFDGTNFIQVAGWSEFASLVSWDAWKLGICASRDGRVWIPGGNHLICYDGRSFSKLTPDQALHIENVCEAQDGAIWLSTPRGMHRYDGKRFEAFTTSDGLANDSVFSCLVAKDGTTWGGTFGGASHYDGITWANLDTRDGLPAPPVNSIAEGADGTIWFGTLGGVCRYQPNRIQPTARILS